MVPTRRTKDRRLARPILMAAAVIGVSAAASTTWAVIPSDALLQRLQPQGDVNDYAGILSPAERKNLEDRTIDLRRKTGAQLAVVILPSLEGGQVDDFTPRRDQSTRNDDPLGPP